MIPTRELFESFGRQPVRTVARRALAGCLAATFVAHASAALADSFAVSASPTSSVQVDLYTNPQDAYVDTLGPNDVSGSADATVSVGLGGNGSFDFNSASLSVANQTVTLTLPNGLGTVDVVMDSVGMGLVSTGGIPVVGNQWNLSSIGAPSSFTVSFNAGTMTLNNATGLALVFLTTPAVIDLDANPINFTLPSLVAAGVSGTADSTSISMVMSNVQIEGFIDAGGLFLDGQMSGSLYLATVPEPGTFALFGVGLIGLAAVRRARSRRS